MKGWLKKLGSDKDKRKDKRHRRSESEGSEEQANYLEEQQEEWMVQYAIATSKSEFDNFGAHPNPNQPQGSRSTAEQVSLEYWTRGSLEFEDRVTDGFYEVYGDFPEVVDKGEFPTLAQLRQVQNFEGDPREVVVVDPQKDSQLLVLLERAADAVGAHTDLKSKIEAMAAVVSAAMGGAAESEEDLLPRWEVASGELKAEAGCCVLPLGALSSGLSRHRALLFKVIADAMGVPCKLLRGRYWGAAEDCAINVVYLDGGEYLVDLLTRPGKLIVLEDLARNIQAQASPRPADGAGPSTSAGSATASPPRAAHYYARTTSLRRYSPASSPGRYPSSPTRPHPHMHPPHPHAHPAHPHGPPHGGRPLPRTASFSDGSLPDHRHIYGPQYAPPAEPVPPPYADSPFTHNPFATSELYPPQLTPPPPPHPASGAPSPFSAPSAAPPYSHSIPPAASGGSLHSSASHTSTAPSSSLPSHPTPGTTSADLITFDSNPNPALTPPRPPGPRHHRTPSHDNGPHPPSGSSSPVVVTASSPFASADNLPNLTPAYSPVTSTPPPGPSPFSTSQPPPYYSNGGGPPGPPSRAHPSSLTPYSQAPPPQDAWGTSPIPPHPRHASSMPAAPGGNPAQPPGGLPPSTNLFHAASSPAATKPPTLQSVESDSPWPVSVAFGQMNLNHQQHQHNQQHQHSHHQQHHHGHSSSQPSPQPSSSSSSSGPPPTSSAPSTSQWHYQSPGDMQQQQQQGHMRHSAESPGDWARYSNAANPYPTIPSNVHHLPVLRPALGAAASSQQQHPGHQQQGHVGQGGMPSSSPQAPHTPAPNMYRPALPSTTDVGDWEIDPDELQVGQRIGIGSYGEVYRGSWRGTDVAIKKFLDQSLSGPLLEEFKREVSILARSRHPNIVLFMGAVTRPHQLSIVTQYVPRGSLFRLLHRVDSAASTAHPLDDRLRLRMASDIAKGLNYLHTRKPPIVHEDLKSPNLLVDRDLSIKVCDFGMSRVKSATFLTARSQGGTPEWMAPEVLRNERIDEKSDVYSYGVVLYELVTGQEPWSNWRPMQVVGAVGFARQRLRLPAAMEPSVAALIRGCWDESPAARPSFNEILELLKTFDRLPAAPPTAEEAASPVDTAPPLSSAPAPAPAATVDA